MATNWINDTDWKAMTESGHALCDGVRPGDRGNWDLSAANPAHLCGNLAEGVWAMKLRSPNETIVAVQYHPRCFGCAPDRTPQERAREVWELAERLAELRKGD